MQMWYSASNKTALDFISKFSGYMVSSLGEYINFSPHFVTMPCINCTPEQKRKHCYDDGKYCSPLMAGKEVADWPGTEVLDEDLREYCLHKKVKAEGKEYKWWDYMSYINANCTELDT